MFYALKREGSEYNWSTIGKLPRRIAYGCSISVEDGVLCIGGCDASAHFSDVFLMRISTDGDRLETIPYPSLPVKSAYCSGYSGQCGLCNGWTGKFKIGICHPVCLVS